MRAMDTSWRTFLLRAAVLGAVIFAAVRSAVARDGVAGGAARSYVTVAGTVTGADVTPGSNTMVFSFHRRGSATPCERSVTANVGADGSFAVEIPTEDPASACPGELFDGSDVQVDVRVNGHEITIANPYVSAVPYAIHADHAAAVTPDSGLSRQLARAENAVPAGTIVAFGGSDAPTGWLLCDGGAVNRTGVYARLFDAIGTAWGAGDGAVTFNLPDLRGRFLRGVDGDAGVDPDRDTRSPSRDGGSAGNRVGTLQTDAVGRHTHRFLVNYNGPGGGGPRGFAYVGGGTGSDFGDTLLDGAAETRPRNAAVNYIIRY